MEQKSWLNILKLSLLPTDLYERFSGRNKRSTHPFLLPLFYSGVLWSSIPQAETGILPNFEINVNKLCCHLFESFPLLKNSRQTSGLWTSRQTLGARFTLLNWRNSYMLITSVFIGLSWKGSCSITHFHWNFGYLRHLWSLLPLLSAVWKSGPIEIRQNLFARSLILIYQ